MGLKVTVSILSILLRGRPALFGSSVYCNPIDVGLSAYPKASTKPNTTPVMPPSWANILSLIHEKRSNPNSILRPASLAFIHVHQNASWAAHPGRRSFPRVSSCRSYPYSLSPLISPPQQSEREARSSAQAVKHLSKIKK
ncbi:hypothetical protein LX32DRAFT_454448 [Colletotrichum zoysiae]|uniref:Secreted protein n=1 Tax=Colletotrichum zoysiae TaxID=1216348 RepID=A0AAD9HDP0_9PEZI|nr:hypothetical protein LX32DRAFT_454448 [Colletotrichum zoysiae]